MRIYFIQATTSIYVIEIAESWLAIDNVLGAGCRLTSLKKMLVLSIITAGT